MRQRNFKTPSGFNDFLPQEEKWRLKLLDLIREKFELFGFLPLETPAVENESLLTGGDENFKKEILRIKRGGEEKDSKEKMALRFDLTVPLARVVNNYFSELKFPFKRYQIGYVWRGEKAQSGRYRQFLQCDADIVGQTGALAEAEIIALAYDILFSLGVENFLIKINNRKILNGLIRYLNISSSQLDDILRIVDKIDKLGEEKVKIELKKEIGLGKEEIKKLFDLFNLKAKDNYELIDLVKEKILNEESREGFEELDKLLGYIEAFKIPEEKWTFDLGTVRGLSYYTGFVFETVLLDLEEVGSVFSGGRYDNLIKKIGGVSLPAVGGSLGFDRTFYALKKLGIIPQNDFSRPSKFIVLYPEEKNSFDAASLVSLLRKNNISSDVYLGKDKKLKEQITYALKNGYKGALIIGDKEIKEKKVVLKIFELYKEETLDIKDVISQLKKYNEEL